MKLPNITLIIAGGGQSDVGSLTEIEELLLTLLADVAIEGIEGVGESEAPAPTPRGKILSKIFFFFLHGLDQWVHENYRNVIFVPEMLYVFWMIRGSSKPFSFARNL